MDINNHAAEQNDGKRSAPSPHELNAFAGMETQLLAAIIAGSDEAILSKTLDGVITSWNPAAERIFGYAAEEVIGRSMTTLFPPELLEEEQSLLDRIGQGGPIEHFESIRVRKDRMRIDVSLTISPIRNAAGEIIGASTIARDISQRKLYERDRGRILAGARCLLWHADIVEAGEEHLWWFLEFAEPEAAQRFLPLEIREGERYQDAWYRARLLEDRVPTDAIGHSSVRAGKSYEQEFRCLCADGAIRWIHEDVQVETIEPERRWRAVGVCTDITERVKLEAQFLQAQKMEGIGRLAGGIAHDFNNLLSVILGYAEMVEMELAPDSDLLPNVQNIRYAATRAAKLTAQLLAFARRQVSAAKVVRPNELVTDMGQILKPLVREDIELVTLLKEDVGLIKVDPSQMEQVLINLVVNARDAIPAGGKIILQTANATLADHYLREETTITSGEYVLIAVSDTGTGMTKEVKGRLFEPFFTTKEVGKGTGLGLATAYGIVKQSRGYIFVYSEVGVGTTVKIYLPRVDEPVTAVKRQDVKGDDLKGSETLLVVEDENLVRNLSVTTLRRSGYIVLEAENGVEALQVAQQYDGRIDLLVSDAIMPLMGGKELVDRIRVLRPETQVLYVSGYTEEVTTVQGILPEGTAFLQKPFTAKALLARVREVLDNTGIS